jgi:hypothetical protein
MATHLFTGRMNEMTEPKADISCKGVIIWSRGIAYGIPQRCDAAISLRASKARLGVMLTVHPMPDYLELL